MNTSKIKPIIRTENDWILHIDRKNDVHKLNNWYKILTTDKDMDYDVNYTLTQNWNCTKTPITITL